MVFIYRNILHSDFIAIFRSIDESDLKIDLILICVNCSAGEGIYRIAEIKTTCFFFNRVIGFDNFYQQTAFRLDTAIKN